MKATILMRLPACAAVALMLLTSSALADPKPTSKEGVDAALTQWKETVESGKVDDIMKLYDRKAVMISTFAQDPLTKRSQIEEYFKRVVVNPDIEVSIEDTHPRVFGNMAANSGRYTLSYTQEGEQISIPARFSFLYVLKGDKWLIIDQHSSRVPLPDELK